MQHCTVCWLILRVTLMPIIMPMAWISCLTFFSLYPLFTRRWAIAHAWAVYMPFWTILNVLEFFSVQFHVCTITCARTTAAQLHFFLNAHFSSVHSWSFCWKYCICCSCVFAVSYSPFASFFPHATSLFSFTNSLSRPGNHFSFISFNSLVSFSVFLSWWHPHWHSIWIFFFRWAFASSSCHISFWRLTGMLGTYGGMFSLSYDANFTAKTFQMLSCCKVLQVFFLQVYSHPIMIEMGWFFTV